MLKVKQNTTILFAQYIKSEIKMNKRIIFTLETSFTSTTFFVVFHVVFVAHIEAPTKFGSPIAEFFRE